MWSFYGIFWETLEILEKFCYFFVGLFFFRIFTVAVLLTYVLDHYYFGRFSWANFLPLILSNLPKDRGLFRKFFSGLVLRGFLLWCKLGVAVLGDFWHFFVTRRVGV